MAGLRVLLTCAGLLLILSGCSYLFENELDKCRKFREYQESSPAPRTVVPEGLAPLPDEQRLQVPYGEANKAPTPADQPCLIEPPDFFDQSAV